jgi:hypothetical protein
MSILLIVWGASGVFFALALAGAAGKSMPKPEDTYDCNIDRDEQSPANHKSSLHNDGQHPQRTVSNPSR